MADVYSEGCEHHIRVSPGQVGRYMILLGDLGRRQAVAEHLDDAKLISSNREYVTYTDTLRGEKVSITSTGTGGPSAAIALEELVHCGADTLICVGTSGGMQPGVLAGDLVVAIGAARMDGTGRGYAPMEYPAVAHYDVVEALRRAGEALGRTVYIGVVQYRDSFHGQHEPENMPISRELEADWEARKCCGASISETESTTLFTVGGVHRVWVGTVLLAIGNQTRREMGLEDVQCHDATRAIEMVIEAMKLLITRDKKKNEGGQLRKKQENGHWYLDFTQR